MFLCCCFYRVDRNNCFAAACFSKFNHTVAQCEQCKIFSNTYVFTGMVNGAALANDDVARDSRLTTVYLYTEAFAL